MQAKAGRKPWYSLARCHRFRQGWVWLAVSLFACRQGPDDSVPLGVSSFKGESPQQAWQMPDSLWLPRGRFNPGIRPQTWWLKTTVANSQERDEEYVLLLNNPHINRMDVYLDGAANPAFQMGDRFPFGERPYSDRDLAVPLSLKAGDSVRVMIHLNKEGETLQLHAEAMPVNALMVRRGTEQMIMGFFTGWMAMVLLFALFLWWQMRQPSALLFAAFTAVLVVWLHAHWGTAFRHWWPEQTWWVGKSRPLLNLSANVLLSLTVLRLFPPRRSDGKLAGIIVLLVLMQLILVATATLTPESAVQVASKMAFLRMTIFVSLVLTLLWMAYLARQWRAGIPYAGFFLSGVAFTFIWNILLQLDQSGLRIGFTHGMYDFGTTIGQVGATALFALGFARIAAGFKQEKNLLALQLLQQEKKAAEAQIAIQESERQRIGRDLHDSIGGMLGSLHMQVDALSRQHPGLPLQPLKELAEQSLQEARSISHNLSPPHFDEWGLRKVLENRVNLLNTHSDCELSFYWNLPDSLPKETSLVLYRICNELLTNVIRHAGATAAMLQLVQDNDQIQIIMEDNGRGIDEAGREGLGLQSIRERIGYLQGTMHIDSSSEGTTTIIQFPGTIPR